MLLKLSKKLRLNRAKKSLDEKETIKTTPTDEDAKFGFNESRRSVNKFTEKSSKPSSQRSSSSSRKDPQPLPATRTDHFKDSSSSTSFSSSRLSQKRGERTTHFKDSSSTSFPSSRLPQQRDDRGPRRSGREKSSTTPSDGAVQKRQNSAPSRRQNRSNFEFSIKSNQHHGNYPSSGLPSEHELVSSRRPPLPTSRIERKNSMVKLDTWVQLQKQKQNSTQKLNRRHPEPIARHNPTTDVRGAPFSSRRYKPGLYNDYMDPLDVASSIMSVPPMYRGKVMTLPRPSSSQEVNSKTPQRRRVPNSKSVNYLSPSGQSNPAAIRSKSAHTLPQDGAKVPYTNTITSPEESFHTPKRTYSDVFSPLPNGRHDNNHFNYDVITKARSPSFCAAISPPSASSRGNNAKQIENQAFCCDDQSLHKDTANLNIEEDDIETNLKRLNELDQTLQQLSAQMQSLLSDKQRLETSLQKAKSNYSMGVGSEYELEQNLSKVKAQLAFSTKKLKEMEIENEDFENEIRSMKAKLLEKLNRKIESRSNQRQLEWELGRVQFIMEGVNKNKAGLVNNMQSLNGDRQLSSLSPKNERKTSDIRNEERTIRSPRDVKKSSSTRKTSSGTLQRPKVSFDSPETHERGYFTLPGRKVPRAGSVDSLTAAQIARFTQPASLRSTNLHRTKSAAERLFAGSHGNVTRCQGPDEIKKIQREINQNRRRTLNGDFVRRTNASRSFTHHDTHMKVGIDVQMAIKHHRMPKVLQRAKRDMQRTEVERQPAKHDYVYEFEDDQFQTEELRRDHVTHDDITNNGTLPVREGDDESPEVYVDVNLTHQLITPDKIDIPDRLMTYEKVEPSGKQEKIQQEKVEAIESMLSRSGQTASHPNVHLAAALAAEVGTVAKAVTFRTDHNKEFPPSLV